MKLALWQNVDFSFTSADTGRKVSVQVIAKRGYVEQPMIVQLYVTHGCVWMTPGEARALAEALQAGADAAAEA